MKATYVEVKEKCEYHNHLPWEEADKITKGREIFKDPITDDGTKKSATGLLHVTKVMNDYVLIDKVTWGEEEGGELQTIYKDGNTFNKTTLNQIRERLKK
jgi:nicotinamide phosphoribosyltransferase